LKGSSSSTRLKVLFPKPPALYWLPEVGERVQLKNPNFPANYGKLAVVTKRCGFGKVRVRFEEDGRSFTAEIRTLQKEQHFESDQTDGRGDQAGGTSRVGETAREANPEGLD
jgi:hypothetical protein